jgi:hypothetical protein
MRDHQKTDNPVPFFGFTDSGKSFIMILIISVIRKYFLWRYCNEKIMGDFRGGVPFESLPRNILMGRRRSGFEERRSSNKKNGGYGLDSEPARCGIHAG